MKKNRTKTTVSLIINVVIVLLTIIGTFLMFTGIKFMHGNEIVLESTKLGMFRFFTVDSNLFMGIIALLFAVEEYKLLKNKISNISKTMYIYKLMATTAVSLTFFIVFSYLGPITKYGIASLLMNSNLFFHLLIPLLSIFNFIIFEKNNNLKVKDALYGLVPTVLYAVFYLINVLIHMEGGKVSPIYDWYWFVQNGIWTAFIVVPIIFGITYIISLLLWKFNKE